MKMTNMFMESQVLDIFLRREDVYIDLGNISSINEEVEEDGSAIFLVYSKTEEATSQFTEFLVSCNMYFNVDKQADGDTTFSVLISEDNISKEVQEPEVEEQIQEPEEEDPEVEEPVRESEVEGEESEDDEGEEDDSDDDAGKEDSDDESEVDDFNIIHICESGCRCINCLDERQEKMETECSDDCRCINCMSII